MDYRENYNRLLNEYQRLGGDPKTLRGVTSYYSLSSEAILRRAIRQLTERREQKAESSEQGSEVSEQKAENNAKLLSDYPPALHPVYMRKKSTWLEVCALKIQLNALPATEEEKALALQWQIWQRYQQMDTDDAALEHWQKYHRLLECSDQKSEEQAQLNKLTPAQLLQRLYTLRSNATARSKSIAKWKEVPNPSFALQEKILRKTEQLHTLRQTIAYIEELLKKGGEGSEVREQ